MCSIARSKFYAKISMVKIFAVFIFVSRGFMRNIRKLAPYENFPLYGTSIVQDGLGILSDVDTQT